MGVPGAMGEGAGCCHASMKAKTAHSMGQGMGSKGHKI